LAGVATAQEPAAYTFLMIAGGDTIASEVVRRTPTSVEGELIHSAAGNRFRFTITLGTDGGAEGIVSSAYRLAEPDAPAFQSVDAYFQGDSVEVQINGNTTRTLKLPTRAGAVPFIEPSSVALEQVLRRTKRMSTAPDTVPVFNLANGRTSPAVVRWVAEDSAQVTLGNIEIHAKVSADGSLLGYTMPKQGSHVIRVEGAQPLSSAGEGG
jgi:hypothetical protein